MMREGDNCSFHELHSGSGYITTICDCGHDINQHYNGGCHDCDRDGFVTSLTRAHGMSVEPQAPPKPSDAARSVRPATRQAHG